MAVCVPFRAGPGSDSPPGGDRPFPGGLLPRKAPIIRTFWAWLLVFCVTAPALAASDVIRLHSGPVVRNDDGVYKGLPYAAPPVGNLRWRPPDPVAPWTEARDFDAFGPQCPQPDADGETSEDCLTLNVWTPARTDGEKLPVMVFIHGGAFGMGAGSLELYDGASLAEMGVVVVTLNYRLGPLGFMAHPLLSAESPRGVSGNYGLLDQQAALAWVRRNIAAFGGDPRNVTIFGQSAGGESIFLHLVSPSAADLFDKAILQSPVGPGSLRPLKTAERGVLPAEEIGLRIAKRLGADQKSDPLAALRSASPDDLLEAAKLGPESAVEVAGMICGPTVDGRVVPDHPLTLVRQGKQRHTPLIIGTTANEASLFLPNLIPPADTPKGYEELVKRRFGPDALRVLAILPGKGPDKETGEETRLWFDLERLLTVRWFGALSALLAREQARAGAPCFVYRYALPPPNGALDSLAEEAFAQGISPEKAGVPHGADLFPVFGLTSMWLGYDDADRDMARAMRTCWTNFAKTGDPGKPVQPGGPAAAPWPRFDPAAPRMIEFGRTIAVKPVLNEPVIPLVERSWRTTTY